MIAGHCHCLDCQKSSGTGHASFAFFPKDKVTVSGTLTRYASKTDAGNTMTRSFCPVCGSRMLGETTSLPDHVGVGLGVFDDSDDFVPAMSFYAKRLRKWDRLAEAIPSFETLPQQS